MLLLHISWGNVDCFLNGTVSTNVTIFFLVLLIYAGLLETTSILWGSPHYEFLNNLIITKTLSLYLILFSGLVNDIWLNKVCPSFSSVIHPHFAFNHTIIIPSNMHWVQYARYHKIFENENTIKIGLLWKVIWAESQRRNKSLSGRKKEEGKSKQQAEGTAGVWTCFWKLMWILSE